MTMSQGPKQKKKQCPKLEKIGADLNLDGREKIRSLRNFRTSMVSVHLAAQRRIGMCQSQHQVCAARCSHATRSSLLSRHEVGKGLLGWVVSAVTIS